jgi:hypothetical protein
MSIPLPLYRRRRFDGLLNFLLRRSGVMSSLEFFGPNGRLVNTGDDVGEAVSALRRDPRKRVC